MFGSPYSLLFTMGLVLSSSSEGSSARVPPESIPVSPQVESIGSDILSVSSPSNMQSPTEDGSTYYFTMRAGTGVVELRSFLSLDLTDYKLSSTRTHGKKPSNVSKFTTWSCASDVISPQSERPTRPFRPLSPIPALRRSSRESLRSIPSPKPAPSSTLPEIPHILDRPPRLPSIAPSPPLSLFPFHRTSSSASPADIVHSQLAPPSPTSPKMTASISSGSISSYDRHKSHMDALARLEGVDPAPLSQERCNFMSMCGDKDEDEIINTPAFQFIIDDSATIAIEEEEDVVIPDSHSPRTSAVQPAYRASVQLQTRRRGSTMDTWFPLRSFIDLKEDDMSSWNWRSFIEIGGAS